MSNFTMISYIYLIEKRSVYFITDNIIHIFFFLVINQIILSWLIVKIFHEHERYSRRFLLLLYVENLKNLLTSHTHAHTQTRRRKNADSRSIFFVCFVMTRKKKKEMYVCMWNERIFCRRRRRVCARARRETDVM